MSEGSPRSKRLRQSVLTTGFATPESTRESRVKDSPSITDWIPKNQYDIVLLGNVAPGPRRITFSARVINIFDQPVQNKSPKAAKGCLKVLVKDDTAVLLIHLWHAEESYSSLQIGSLVTAWATHISSNSSYLNLNPVQPPPAAILTSMFPEKDRGCSIDIHPYSQQHSIYRLPLNFRHGNGIEGTIGLREFVRGDGSEIGEAKILVYVTAVGRPSTYSSPMPRTDGPRVALNVGVADAGGLETEAILILTSPHLIRTALKRFIPYNTVLLISYPGWKAGSKISVRARTQIEVDPSVEEAKELRRWARSWNRPVNEVVKEHRFTYLRSVNAKPPLRHNFASFSGRLDIKPWLPRIAYIPMILSGLNILPLLQQKRIFCMPCHESAGFHNEGGDYESKDEFEEHPHTPSPSSEAKCTSTTVLHGIHPTLTSQFTHHLCPSCGRPVNLRLNPATINDLHDETGSLATTFKSGNNYPSSQYTPASGSPLKNRAPNGHTVPPILWTDTAYTSLLGRSPEELGRLCLASYGLDGRNSVSEPSLRNTATNESQKDPRLDYESQAVTLLRYLERRLAWVRIILLVGWTGEEEEASEGEMENALNRRGVNGGRLVVLDVVR